MEDLNEEPLPCSVSEHQKLLDELMTLTKIIEMYAYAQSKCDLNGDFNAAEFNKVCLNRAENIRSFLKCETRFFN